MRRAGFLAKWNHLQEYKNRMQLWWKTKPNSKPTLLAFQRFFFLTVIKINSSKLYNFLEFRLGGDIFFKTFHSNVSKYFCNFKKTLG